VYWLCAKNYYARIELSQDKIFLIGNKIKAIKIENIDNIEVVSWNIANYFNTYGSTIFFARNHLLIRNISGKKYYLKSNNALYLKEDIEKIIEKRIKIEVLKD
jgi:helix-turn-helix protein